MQNKPAVGFHYFSTTRRFLSKTAVSLKHQSFTVDLSTQINHNLRGVYI